MITRTDTPEVPLAPVVAGEVDPPVPAEELIPRLSTPPRGFRRWFARTVLRAGGWEGKGNPPALDKYLLIAAPHTTWWDGFWMVAFAWSWGLHVSWLVKSSTVNSPFRLFLRWVGAVPVDRGAQHGLVGQLAREFRQRDRLLLVISPEGTRAKRTHWKSGFYHIARAAEVPICLTFLDYGSKSAGFGPCFTLTGDVGNDMQRVRDFYATVTPRHPAKFTEPRLPEEEPPALDR